MKTNLQTLQEGIVNLINEYVTNNGNIEELPKLLSVMAIICEGSIKVAKSIHYLHNPEKHD